MSIPPKYYVSQMIVFPFGEMIEAVPSNTITAGAGGRTLGPGQWRLGP